MVLMGLPDCFWSWLRWGHQGPAWSDRCEELSGSNIPPPHTCPGSDTAKPGYSAASPHLGGPSPTPVRQAQTHTHRSAVYRLFLVATL